MTGNIYHIIDISVISIISMNCLYPTYQLVMIKEVNHNSDNNYSNLNVYSYKVVREGETKWKRLTAGNILNVAERYSG